MEGIEFLKPNNKRTQNLELITKAFRAGMKAGITFMNESDDGNYARWKKEAFKEFVEKNKIRL